MKKIKGFYSALALIFSLGAAGSGYLLLGSGSLGAAERFLYGFFFIGQFVFSALLVLAFSVKKSNVRFAAVGLSRSCAPQVCKLQKTSL